MPVSPDYAANLAKVLRELYVDAEEQLLSRIAASLARGLDAPDWAQRQLQQLTAIRTSTERLIARLTEKAGGELYSALFAAYSQGVATAGTDLTALGESIGIAFGGVDAQAVEALVTRSKGIQADLGQVGLKIVSSAPRRYRDVVERVAGRMLAGASSRREAAASAVKDLASSGITRFVDTAGRSWELGSYAEMATRTASGQAMVQGHVDRLQSSGRDLVMVSDAPEECKLCRPWEGKVLSLGGTPPGRQIIDGHDVIVAGTLREATSDGLFHPNCFPGGVLVTSPSGVRAADARWYEGEVVVINTASGQELTVTPNHPILTPEGWVNAGAIEVGGRVLRYLPWVERVDGMSPGDEDVPTPIGDVFETLRQSGEVSTMTVPAAAEQFHGDGFDADVEIVLSHGLLRDWREAGTAQVVGDGEFVAGRMRSGSLLAERPTLKIVGGSGHSANCVVSGGSECGSFIGGHPGNPTRHSLSASYLRSGPLESVVDGGLTDSKGGRDLALSLAGTVSADDVVDVKLDTFRGHVYNLESESGWYVASSIVVHNCRHRTVVYVPGRTRPLTDTAGPAGDKLRQQQRYRERRVRELKRRVAALEPLGATDELRKAKATLRAYSAEFKAWREDNDRKNLAYRSNITSR